MNKIRHMSKKIDIISLYLDDYNKSLTGREIARQCNINPQTALNHLNTLTKLKLLTVNKKGRNKEYALNLQSPKLQPSLCIAEHTKALVRLNTPEIYHLIAEISILCQTIILFGSFADQQETKTSDIDLLTIKCKDKKKINNIIKRHPRKIHIEHITLSDFTKAVKNKTAFALEVQKKHILFGNIEPIIEKYISSKW